MKPARIAAFVGAALYATLLWADAAAWYLWRSPHAEGSICAQVSPGDGWVVVKGPYQDSACKKKGVPH